MGGATVGKVYATLAWLAILVGALLALAIVGMIGYVVGQCVWSWLSPVRRAAATVLRKTQRGYEVTRSGWRCSSPITAAVVESVIDGEPYGCYSGEETEYDYFITFAFDGRQQEFAVKEELYASVHEGDEGLLVYKGNMLKHFIPGATQADDAWRT